MAKSKSALIKVMCPCCQAELEIDPALSAVIHHKAHEKPREMSDLEEAMERQKGEAQKREDAFRKSVADHESRQTVLDRKFEELLRKAKEEPDSLPLPKRDIDFD
ncbi:MAG: hypothetical protein K2X35_05335 [Bryobacteraceae bacterium]|nr:hypothetical protein [Bryobacteraceae bacterium]